MNKRPLKLLCIEDNPTDVLFVERVLNDFIPEIMVLTKTDTLKDGLRLLQERPFDLVILDLTLPDSDGLATLSRVRRHAPQLPVVIYTANDDDVTALRALEAGAQDYVVKSHVSSQAMLRIIRYAIKRKSLEGLIYLTAECVPSCMVIVGADGRIIYVNSRVKKTFGYRQDELIGRLVGLLMPEKDRENVTRAFGQSRPDTWCAGREIDCVRKDGDIFPAEVSFQTIGTPEGTRLLISLTDITQRKRAEQRIREQASLLDNTFDAVVVQNLKGTIEYWNAGATRLYGWAVDEALGRNASDLFGDESGREEAEEYSLNGSNDEWSGPLRHKTKDGNSVFVETHWTLMRDESGQAKAKMMVGHDITDRKRLEAQINRHRRMESLGTLAGGIAHDMNNALSPILLSVSLFARKLTDPSSLSMIESLRTSVLHCKDMVKRLVAFSRGGDGDMAVLSPTNVLHELETILLHSLPKSIKSVFSIEENLACLMGDSTQLQEMLLNLCVNARDAMPYGGTLTVSACNTILNGQVGATFYDCKPGSYVAISVADTGAGIPPAIIDRIFDPFFTTKEVGKGTGFGLATAHGIAKTHGGFIDVNSELKKGSRFTVYLPAAESRTPSDSENGSPTLTAGNGEVVLLAEDEKTVCDMTRETLEVSGYRVLTAGNGVEALDLFRRHEEIDVVITDLVMPDMDGPSAIRAMREIDAQVPIIVVSGLRMSDSTVGLLNADVQAYLAKPYESETLLATLCEVLHSEAKGRRKRAHALASV